MEDLSIKRLEPKERVILMNEIWESFDDEKLHIESPKWHKEILLKRIQKIKEGKARYVLLEELKSI